MLRNVTITNQHTPSFSGTRRARSKRDASATNRTDLGAQGVVRFYSRRFSIEETFRDGSQ